MERPAVKSSAASLDVQWGSAWTPPAGGPSDSGYAASAKHTFFALAIPTLNSSDRGHLELSGRLQDVWKGIRLGWPSGLGKVCVTPQR
jgi:hypothetical protein